MDDNGIHVPFECSHKGDFDCDALAACKSTIQAPNTVSYLDSNEAICKPTKTADRKKAALDYGDAPFGWSDGDDNVWALHQPLEGKAKPPFDDFAAKLKLMNAAGTALENAKKQYNDAVESPEVIVDELHSAINRLTAERVKVRKLDFIETFALNQ